MIKRIVHKINMVNYGDVTKMTSLKKYNNRKDKKKRPLQLCTAKAGRRFFFHPADPAEHYTTSPHSSLRAHQNNNLG